MMCRIELLLYFSLFISVLCDLQNKRLLENDPTFIIDRLNKLETTVQQLQNTCNHTEGKLCNHYFSYIVHQKAMVVLKKSMLKMLHRTENTNIDLAFEESFH